MGAVYWSCELILLWTQWAETEESFTAEQELLKGKKLNIDNRATAIICVVVCWEIKK